MKTYLDMDGVLADFFSEAVKYSEVPHTSWRDMEYRDVKRLLDKVKKDETFFLRLRPYPMVNTLVQSVYNIAGGFSILTSPLAGHNLCEEHKIRWIEEHLLLDPEEIIVTSDKTKFASENCRPNILIDDYGYNIREWEAAAGFGIKYQADEQHISDVITPLMALYKNVL